MAELPPETEFETEFEFEEGDEDFPEETSNRPFIIASIALGGLFIVGLLCIGLYLVFIAPRQRDANATQVAEINATNTQVVLDAQATADAAAGTGLESPTPVVTEEPTEAAVAEITDTPVIATPSDTPPPPTITPTDGPSPTPSNTPTPLPTIDIGDVTNTPTRLPTIAIGGGGETQQPGDPTATATALPDTGFADEVGGPILIVLALGLVAVMVVARRLRLSGS